MLFYSRKFAQSDRPADGALQHRADRPPAGHLHLRRHYELPGVNSTKTYIFRRQRCR